MVDPIHLAHVQAHIHSAEARLRMMERSGVDWARRASLTNELKLLRDRHRNLNRASQAPPKG